MHTGRTAALVAGLLMAGGAGAAVAPVAHGQSRDREPVVRALQLLARGAQIGVTVHDPGKDDKTAGVIVDEVEKDSPAAKAGIKTGDAIVEFDGERVRSTQQLRRLVDETPDERSVPVAVVRDGQRVTVSVEPDRQADGWRRDGFAFAPPAPPRIPSPPRTYVMPALPGFEAFSVHTAGRIGVVLESLTDQLRDYFGVKGGVLVRSVEDDSAASKAGFKAGDVIVSANGHSVDDPSDVSDEIMRVERPGDISFEVVRDRKTQTVKVHLEARTTRTPRVRTIL